MINLIFLLNKSYNMNDLNNQNTNGIDPDERLQDPIVSPYPEESSVMDALDPCPSFSIHLLIVYLLKA